MTSFTFNDDDDDDEDIDVKVTSDLSDISDAEDDHQNGRTTENNSRLSVQSDLSSTSFNCESRLSISSPDSNTNQDNSRKDQDNSRTDQDNSRSSQGNSGLTLSTAGRPRIWSIEEIMNTDSSKSKSTSHQQQLSSTIQCRSRNVTKTEQDSQTDNIDSNRYTLNGLKQSNSTCSTTRTETATAPCESNRTS